MDLIKEILNLGKGILTMPTSSFVEVSSLIINLIDRTRQVANNDEAEELKALRDRLEARVLDHAEETARYLRGE